MQNSNQRRFSFINNVCLMCGGVVENRDGRGRPKIFCTIVCREAIRSLRQFQAYLDRAELTQKGAKMMARELMSTVSGLTNKYKINRRKS